MQIRLAGPRDLEACAALDHSYTTDHVWQMEVREENGVPTVSFRLARLPREMRVNYARQDEGLLAGWQQRDGFLVAGEQGYIHGYVGLTAQVELGIARVGDLVVDRPSRRRGIGTALLRAAAQWGREQDLGWLLVEVQTKNYPAIRFCRSRGLTFCGYNDHYWPSRDIALFFGESL
ncbi:MAG: GNAT family N-acetyltransferase [Anaerolineae bacterium]